MFKIVEIELKNFIGLKKISNKDGVFKLSLEDNLNKEIIMIFGENGLGKTTLLENLTPYSNMLSREVKKSISYPAYKKIKFLEDKTGDEYFFEVFWEDEKTTKGYIHLNGEILEETSKGNITEFNYETGKLFGDFSKFKNSLFLQQGVLDIVKAKPSERVKIINSFMNELEIYNKIKDNVTDKISILKGKTLEYREKIEELKGYENRYVDLKKFEEEFDNEEFETQQSLLPSMEEKYLDVSKKLSVKENLEREIAKNETDLKSYTNSNIENQMKSIEEELEIAKRELSQCKDPQNLHQELLDLNNAVNITKNILNTMNLLSIDNRDKTIVEIEEELEGLTATSASLKIREKEILSLKEEIQNFMNKEVLLEDLKTDLKELQEELLKIDSDKPDKPEEDFEEIVSLLQNIENEGKKLREESVEKEKNVEESKRITEKIESITQTNKILEEKKNEYGVFLKEEDKLKELQDIIENTNENHECNSCGQEVNIEKLKIKILSIEKLLQNSKKEDLLKAKTDFEENEITLIQLQREREIKNQRIGELSKDYEALLEGKKEEYVKYNKVRHSILKYNEYNEKVMPLKNKISVLSEKILETEKTLKKPETTLQEITEKIKDLNDNIEKVSRTMEKTRHDLNLISNHNINKDKTLRNLMEDMGAEIAAKEKKMDQLKKDYEETDRKNKAMNELKDKKNFLNEENAKYKTKLLKNLDLKNSLEEYKEISQELVREIKEEYTLLKNEIEKKKISMVEYKKDLELINLKLEEYEKIKANVLETENEIFTLSKIKNYSDRIKKASITEFFSSISDFINKIISSEKGTLSGMKIRISQKNNAKNFDILVDNNGEEVKDISLLSGAEQGTVARAIYFALAQFSNFGIIWLDECDGMLSDTNKEVFIEMLMKMKDMIGLNQIIFISHNRNLIYKTDMVIDLNQMVTNQ